MYSGNETKELTISKDIETSVQICGGLFFYSLDESDNGQ